MTAENPADAVTEQAARAIIDRYPSFDPISAAGIARALHDAGLLVDPADRDANTRVAARNALEWRMVARKNEDRAERAEAERDERGDRLEAMLDFMAGKEVAALDLHGDEPGLLARRVCRTCHVPQPCPTRQALQSERTTAYKARAERAETERDAEYRKYAQEADRADTLEAENAELRATVAAGQASDGYHTHNELYEYRLLYNAALFNAWARDNRLRGSGSSPEVVKSWRHSDGEPCFGGGWFIVVATLPTGQISNHYQAEHWDLFDIPESVPPNYDGHTPSQVAQRLRAALDGAGEQQ